MNFFGKKNQNEIFDGANAENEDAVIWDGESEFEYEDEVKDSENDEATFGGIDSSHVSIKVVAPKTLTEVVAIADCLINGSSVIINIEELGENDVVRFMDYLQGVLHVIKGNMKQVSKNTCVASPRDVEIDSIVPGSEE